jgi:LAO/AO transport system kinase
MTDWVDEAFAGQRRAIARLMSMLENAEGDEVRRILARIYPHTGRARVLGVTGAPGAGKSTLLGQVAAEYRRRGLTVGIVAVDPSSPFSGGALLGDRIRMRALSGDPGVFIRSMASRGLLGGMARHTHHIVQVFDACGYARILIETVGAGQADVEIAKLADTTVVLQVPGLGDDIQALKAGILEIADVLVVNKADLEGADRTAAALANAMAPLAHARTSPESEIWRPPILKTVSTTSEGIVEVVDAVEKHMAYSEQSGLRWQHLRARMGGELESILRDLLWRRFGERVDALTYEQMLARVMTREIDPYRASEELLQAAERPS